MEYSRYVNKKWKEDNKEFPKQYNNEKVMCDTCGCQSTRNNLLRHQRTKKCKKKTHTNDNYILVGGRIYLKGESPLEGVWHADHTPFEVKRYVIFENGVERGVTITTI